MSCILIEWACDAKLNNDKLEKNTYTHSCHRSEIILFLLIMPLAKKPYKIIELFEFLEVNALNRHF